MVDINLTQIQKVLCEMNYPAGKEDLQACREVGSRQKGAICS